MKDLKVKDKIIRITGLNDDDYISLTDISRFVNDSDPRYPIQNWMRLKDTIDYLGLWEILNNNHFNRIEFDTFKNEAGKNSFVMTPTKWINSTNAIGIKTKAGKYGGGTYAHRDIAFEFASWVSPEIKLYIIKEFQRLKKIENKKMEWNAHRLLSKFNYLLQTNSIKNNLINQKLTINQINKIYASEADVLNVALFGCTASEWSLNNPDLKGNIRDYATLVELAILSNLEFKNSQLIEIGISQKERLILLNREANKEKNTFNKNIKRIKN